jgi:hypothetical protein
MRLLLAFAPFIAFAAVDLLIGPREGLIAGAAVSALVLLRDWLNHKSAKVLEIGSVLLFGGLAIWAFTEGATWSIIGVRLRVDAGLLIIVLVSLAIGRPFTLQHARDEVPQEHWNSPAFVRTNYVITAIWALAFAVLVIADLVLLYLPEVPHRVGILATILALVGAFKFTAWYPKRGRKDVAA